MRKGEEDEKRERMRKGREAYDDPPCSIPRLGVSLFVLDEPLELLRVVRATVVGGPGVADGEFVELQHVHHPDLCHGAAKQLWTLVHARRW